MHHLRKIYKKIKYKLTQQYKQIQSQQEKLSLPFLTLSQWFLCTIQELGQDYIPSLLDPTWSKNMPRANLKGYASQLRTITKTWIGLTCQIQITIVHCQLIGHVLLKHKELIQIATKLLQLILKV